MDDRQKDTFPIQKWHQPVSSVQWRLYGLKKQIIQRFYRKLNMEKERNSSHSSTSPSTASSTINVSCGGAKIKQEEITEKGTLEEYQANLEKVLDEYTKRYEQLPLKRQIHRDNAFDTHVEALVDFYHKYGHWEVPHKGEYVFLCRWVEGLRKVFRCAYYKGGNHGNHTLPRHRYEKLVAIGFPFVENQDDNDLINDSSCSIASPSTANKNRVLVRSAVKQEEIEDGTLEYQANLDKVLDEYTARYEQLSRKRRILIDKAFDRHFEALVDFHRENGHWEVPCTGKYTSLYAWVENICRMFKCAHYEGGKYGNYTLPRHRYDKLAAIDFPFVDNKDDNDSIIDSSCSRASPSNNVLADSKLKEEDMEEDGTLEYKANLDKVLDEYTKRYEQLSKKRRKHNDKAFDRHVEALVDFHREHGHWEIPKSTERGLFNWVKNVRVIFRCAYYEGESYGNNILPRHRYEKLVAIGFPFDENKTAHEDDSPNTTSSNSVLGSSEVKQEEIEDRTLEYQANLEKVLDEFTERYEQLPLKRQINCDKAFDKHVEALVDFHREYGHWKVSKTEKELYDWLGLLHGMYRLAYYDGKLHQSAFPRHRFEKLVSIGYPFEKIMPNLPSLVSINVRKSKRIIENEQKKIISKEIEEDRSTERDPIDYKRNLDNAIKKYTDRYEQRKHPGADRIFDVNFQNLIEFYNKFGHFKVPKSNKEYRQLHNWVEGIHKTHRYAYFHGKNNGDIKLTRDRYDRLVAIGFPFKTIESEKKDPSNSRLHLNKHNSTTSERNATKPSKAKMQKMLTKTSADKKKKATTMKMSHIRTQKLGENEVQSLKKKIRELEKENETHYATIYRLKDEKDALEEKVEEQNRQIEKLKVCKKRVQQFEYHKEESIASSCSKRQRNDLESNYVESEDFQQERQLLIHQFTTENHRQIPDSSSSKSSITMQSTCSESSKEAEIKRLQQERQVLIDQLRASTENYKQILDLVPRYKTM